MSNKKSLKFVCSLGLLVFALILLPCHSWARDGDGDGYDTKIPPIDCNDKVYAINPGVTEICDDGIDNNCNDLTDADDPACDVACTDGDLDLYYAEAGCGTFQDCNDADYEINPGVPEDCSDQVDNNCDGFTNESCSACTDTDGDTFFAEAACDDNPVDCDDGDSTINPGANDPAPGDLPNGIDNNCDGQVDEEYIVASDSDGDGFLDSDELNGFSLKSRLSVWDESLNGWGNIIKGEELCSQGEKCLNRYKEDLFVIWRPHSPSKIEDITSFVNIFEFAKSPVSNFTVWILKEDTGFESLDRVVTDASYQKAVVLIEDPAMYGATGFSEPGSIMTANKGRAWIYSYQIDSNVDRCDGVCKVDGVLMSDIEIKELHFKNTAAHEIWHVLFALNTADLHISDDNYIMNPATVLIEKKNGAKSYTIGDEFSPAGLTDPELN